MRDIIYEPQSKLWELWESRSVSGDFSKRCGNGGKIVFDFSTVSIARQFPQLPTRSKSRSLLLGRAASFAGSLQAICFLRWRMATPEIHWPPFGP